MKEEKEIRKLAEDYIDSCTKKSGFVILAESLKGDFIDLFVAGFMKCLEVNKTDEWHFVSKEGFPNKNDIYLIIRSDGLHLGDYCCGGDGDIDCQSWCDYPSEEEIQDDSVIAWKEITLPDEE